jgi:hypothetical protein
MNDALAHERLNGVLELMDHWGDLYERRWGKRAPYQDQPGLDNQVKEGIDEVRTRTKFAHDMIAAMGENELAKKVVEHNEGAYSSGHPFTQARVAIVEGIAILSQREELDEIVGPVGPRLSVSEFHPAIWGAAAALWDDGYFPRRFRPLPRPSKGYCKRNPARVCRARTSACSFQRANRRKAHRAFDFAGSTPSLSRRRGSQLMRALPLWSVELSWASGTSCPIGDGPSRAPMRPLRCSPF